jgi:hypothetical protein
MNRDIPGKYIHVKTGSHYLELKPDGNYFLFEGTAGVTGAYEVNGAEITIFGADSTSRGKIQDGVIVDSEGDRWIRAKGTEEAPANRKVRIATQSITNEKKESTRDSTTISDDPLASMSWLPAILRRDDFPWELVEAAGLFAVLVVLCLVAIIKRP